MAAPPPTRMGLADLHRILGVRGPSVRMLRRDLSSVHLATQAIRFCRLFVVYFTAHAVFPAGTPWQVLGLLTATSAEAAVQQLFPTLPLGRVLHAIMSSPVLCRYLGALHTPDVSSAPSTAPVVAPGPSPATQTTTGYTPVTSPAPGAPQADTPK